MNFHNQNQLNSVKIEAVLFLKPNHVHKDLNIVILKIINQIKHFIVQDMVDVIILMTAV